MHKADNLPPSCADVKISGGLNLLEPCGPVQACNGTALSLHLPSVVTENVKAQYVSYCMCYVCMYIRLCFHGHKSSDCIL